MSCNSSHRPCGRGPFYSVAARKGVGLFGAPRRIDAPGSPLARALRQAGVSDAAASVLDVLRPDECCVFDVMRPQGQRFR